MLTYFPSQYKWRKKRNVASVITLTLSSLYTYFRKIKTNKWNINKLYTTNEKPRSLKNFCFLYCIDLQSKCLLNKIYQYDMMTTILNRQRNVVFFKVCKLKDWCFFVWNWPLWCTRVIFLKYLTVHCAHTGSREDRGARSKARNEKHVKLVQILLKDAENAKTASTDMERQINARTPSRRTRTSCWTIVCWPTSLTDI
jgi:hypothetical protein